MDKQRRVVLYGSSLFILGIEASLRECNTLEVIRMDRQPDHVLDCLDALDPDVIAYDSTFGESAFIIPLLEKNPDLILVGLNLASNRALVLSGKQFTVVSSVDLVQVIDNKVDGSAQQSSGDFRPNL